MSLSVLSSVQPVAVAPVQSQPSQSAAAHAAATPAPPPADKVSISPAAQHAAAGDADHDGH